MGENLSNRFATMSEEERRRFAQEQEEAAAAGEVEEASQELEFDEPRRDHARTKADLEDRDGTGALVDDEEHQRRVRKQARARKREPGESA
jgi:hypothetical protein